MFSTPYEQIEGRQEHARKRNLQAVLGLLKMKNNENSVSFRNMRIQKNDFQKNVLREVFKLTRFPTKQTRDDLALLLNHTNRGIQIWFQNQRNNRDWSDEERHGQGRNSSKDMKNKHGNIDIMALIDIIENNIPGDKKYFWEKFINHVPRYY